MKTLCFFLTRALLVSKFVKTNSLSGLSLSIGIPIGCLVSCLLCSLISQRLLPICCSSHTVCASNLLLSRLLLLLGLLDCRLTSFLLSSSLVLLILRLGE